MASTILLVDDEPDLAATCQRLLIREGYRVRLARTCHEALAALEANATLALVVADIRLPDGNGLEIVRAARAKPRPLPAIVITGFASAATRSDALTAGASAFLAKPFGAAAFVALVRDVLGPPLANGPSR